MGSLSWHILQQMNRRLKLGKSRTESKVNCEAIRDTSLWIDVKAVPPDKGAIEVRTMEDWKNHALKLL